MLVISPFLPVPPYVWLCSRSGQGEPMKVCDMSSVLVEHEARVDAAPKAHILLVDDNPIKRLAMESARAHRQSG
jgi:hypothetical protein